MKERDFISILEHIVSKGIEAIKSNTECDYLPLDYVAVFSKDEKEFDDLKNFVSRTGTLNDNGKTGETYVLKKPIDVFGHPLKVIKVRKPDLTRPYRGGPDFRVPDYASFKEKYIKGRNFSLMIRDNFEMMELKGEDVLVYFPDRPVTQQLGL